MSTENPSRRKLQYCTQKRKNPMFTIVLVWFLSLVLINSKSCDRMKSSTNLFTKNVLQCKLPFCQVFGFTHVVCCNALALELNNLSCHRKNKARPEQLLMMTTTSGAFPAPSTFSPLQETPIFHTITDDSHSTHRSICWIKPQRAGIST